MPPGNIMPPGKGLLDLEPLLELDQEVAVLTLGLPRALYTLGKLRAR